MLPPGIKGLKIGVTSRQLLLSKISSFQTLTKIGLHTPDTSLRLQVRMFLKVSFFCYLNYWSYENAFYALFVRGNYFVRYELYKSAFLIYSLRNLAFCLSLFCIFCQFCFEFDVIFKDLYIYLIIFYVNKSSVILFSLYRGGFRPVATSKMKLFVIIVNGFQPLAIITKCSILDVAAVLDSPLLYISYL